MRPHASVCARSVTQEDVTRTRCRRSTAVDGVSNAACGLTVDEDRAGTLCERARMWRRRTRGTGMREVGVSLPHGTQAVHEHVTRRSRCRGRRKVTCVPVTDITKPCRRCHQNPNLSRTPPQMLLSRSRLRCGPSASRPVCIVFHASRVDGADATSARRSCALPSPE
jgi:hypothetical protein